MVNWVLEKIIGTHHDRECRRLWPAVMALMALCTLVAHGASIAWAESEDNAAIWYERALTAFEAPSDALQKEIIGVVNHGWKDDHPALEEFLIRSAPAIEHLNRGTQIAACDFLKGQAYPSGMAALELKLPYPNLLWLARTLLLEGRRREREGQEDAALTNYLEVMRIAKHYSQQLPPTLLGKLLPGIYQEMAYGPIEQLIHRSSITPERWRQALQELDELQPMWHGLDQAYETEHRTMYSAVSDFLNGEVKKKPWGKERVDQFLTEYDRLLTQYYALVLEMARQDASPAATHRLEEFVERIRQETRSMAVVSNMMQDLPSLFTGKITAKDQAKRFLLVGVGDHLPTVQRFNGGRARMNLLMGAIALHIYELEHGAPPQEFSQLPEDPFGDGKPLQYVHTNSGWRLYSIGPDRIDQQGTVVLTSEQLLIRKGDAPSGDIVCTSN